MTFNLIFDEFQVYVERWPLLNPIVKFREVKSKWTHVLFQVLLVRNDERYRRESKKRHNRGLLWTQGKVWCVFIITEKVKSKRGGGEEGRCRCYDSNLWKTKNSSLMKLKRLTHWVDRGDSCFLLWSDKTRDKLSRRLIYTRDVWEYDGWVCHCD
jgi:hypothetical protein